MLKGTYTAIVTPFNSDGSIDEESYRNLVEEQIKAGITGVFPCGSTGESSTLDHKEHIELIKITVDQVKDRCDVLAGTGSNSTREAIEMTKSAEKTGVTSSVQIVPYYNKPTQKGLFDHFKAIAESVKIPIIVYNIQGRTAVNLETSTLFELAKIKNITGVKEGSGNIFQIMEVIKTMPKDFSVLIGDDKLTFLAMALGGHGVISVASNVMPERIKKFVDLGLKNDFLAMREEHFKLDEFFNKLFIETNPIPVKKILSLKGKIKPFYRMPLCEPSDSSTAALKELIKKYNI